jgi:UDP-glucose 4-epimerase
VVQTVTAQNNRLLITGATGFVGQALCRYLLAQKGLVVPEASDDREGQERKEVQENPTGRGSDIQLLIREPTDISKIPLQLGAGFILGSMQDEASLVAACSGINQIIHLAGLAHVAKGSDQQGMDTTIQGTHNLLDAAIDAGVSRIVYLSSSLAEAAASSEGDATVYGESKLQAERLLQGASNEGKIEVVILRAVNVYGPGMKGNIASMISMIDRGRLPPLPRLNNKISLLSVNDLAQALLLALDVRETKQQIYTLTDGQQYSVEDIQSAIYRALDKPMPSWRTPHMVLYAASLIAGAVSSITGGSGAISSRTYRNLTSDNLFSNERAIADLGFSPSTDFFQLLPKIVKAVRNTAD